MTQQRNSEEGTPPNRPLTARSVLASALLGMEPPELPVAQLVRLTGLFGIGENRARVALSRMVARGEVTTAGNGNYRLAGHLVERQSRQSASRSGRTTSYRGDWVLAVVTRSGSSAEVRTARRRDLAYARLAELREGVWMRPANIEVVLPTASADHVEVMTARPDDPRQLAATLWDLPGWASRARDLERQMEALALDGPAALGPGFELSAAVLRHLQADPLLPREIVPSDWPGTRLRQDYDGWDARYRHTLREWSRAG
jgi:phenylacetic acid degradation operon negative regulatory protein